RDGDDSSTSPATHSFLLLQINFQPVFSTWHIPPALPWDPHGLSSPYINPYSTFFTLHPDLNSNSDLSVQLSLQFTAFSDSLQFLRYGSESYGCVFCNCGDFVGGRFRSGTDIGSSTVAGPRRCVFPTDFRCDYLLLADLLFCRSSQELDRSLFTPR
ncbi:hypothetical protein AABB24_001091, partial [Solanum stoloniferum]